MWDQLKSQTILGLSSSMWVIVQLFFYWIFDNWSSKKIVQERLSASIS
jgi:hypothetical protein